MSIDLYVMPLSPPCRAVMMLAKQLNLNVNIKLIDLMKGEQNAPEFVKINPAHCVPTLVDNGFVLWESRAIMQYLASKYGSKTTLYPTDLQKRAIVDRYLNFDFSLGASIGQAITYKFIRKIEPTEAQLTNFKNNVKLLDTLLGDKTKFAAGNDLTIADLSLIADLTIMSYNGYQDLSDAPNVKKYVERLSKELPYFNEINGGIPEAFKKFEAMNKK